MIRFYFIAFLLVSGGICRLAAQERMVVSNASVNGQTCVWIKWYDEKVFYPEGVNIYRTSQASAQRIKLNDKPVKKGDYPIPKQLFLTDTTLTRYVEMAEKAKPEEVKGLLSLFLIVKTFENNEYAKYAGIMQEDCMVISGETYSYEVYEIIDGREKLIEKSPFLLVNTFVPDRSPDSLQIVAGDGKVSMRWKPETQRYWGINVYRKTMDETSFRLVTKRPIMLSEVPKEDGSIDYPDTFYAEENLRNGMAYTYKIQGIDYFFRPTLFTEEITVTPKDKTPPAAPHNVHADVGLLDITLTWQNDFPSSDMKGYTVYRRKGRKGKNMPINGMLLSPAQTIYHDTVSGPGAYIYHVAAVDSSGNEGLSFPTVGEVLDIFPPAPPTGLQVAADTGRIQLSWNPNPEKDLMGYRIYRTVGANRDDNYVLLNAKAIQATQFTDSLPRNAKNFFFYKVAAIDSAYNMSKYSDPRSARMPDVIAPREPFIIGVIQEARSLRIEWLSNAESDLMGYAIYRFQPSDSAGTLQRLNTSLIKAGTHLFTDHWIEKNMTYRYYLTAVDSTGNISAPSVPYDGKFIADEECFLEIKKLKASAKKNGTVPVSWSVDKEDKTTYQGCILYRKTPQTNAYKAITPLSKATKYTDKFEPDDALFYYQVRAYDQKGCVVKSEEIEIRRKGQ
jgi:fibronectin type 3 domain-containing protein